MLISGSDDTGSDDIGRAGAGGIVALETIGPELGGRGALAALV